MRTQSPGRHRVRRLFSTVALVVGLAGIGSGVLIWVVAQGALLLTLHAPISISLKNAQHATWRLVFTGRWGTPASAFPTRPERLALPGVAWWFAAIMVFVGIACTAALLCWRLLRGWGAGSPLAYAKPGPRRWLRDIGAIRARTWARVYDLRRLWVPAPTRGRPYLGWIGRAPGRMLAAEREVQALVVSPPRSGKSTGYVIPWLLDHEGPALVLSVKRDIYDATVAYRRGLGRIWVYDPFGARPSCSYSPLSSAHTWEGALRAATALSSAAHADHTNAASEFWDREASVLLAPLLYAARLTAENIATVLHWLDTRDFAPADRYLEDTGADAAAAQLRSVLARDPRNRETTVMSAASLLGAYRYPRVTRTTNNELTPEAFFASPASTIYVVAAAHHQRDLQPAILALVTAIYETAIETAREHGAFDPPLYLLLDEAANIAPVRDLAPWLSQCGDSGITIATSWQSIAQIEQRYGRAERDAILAASTAQLFLPPLTDPTTTDYLTGLLGEETVAHTTHNRHGHNGESISVNQQSVANTPWLRQISPGSGLLIYRDLPPAVVRAPRWFADPRFARYQRFVRSLSVRAPD